MVETATLEPPFRSEVIGSLLRPQVLKDAGRGVREGRVPVADYDAVLDGYHRVRSLKPGWRNRIGLHQLFPLLAHVVLFGGGYAGQTHAAARTALAA